jgi:hypothetical protein
MQMGAYAVGFVWLLSSIASGQKATEAQIELLRADVRYLQTRLDNYADRPQIKKP